jgi:4-amino-4-deoxy-L-arabinose transferase-like glycosyltransferase
MTLLKTGIADAIPRDRSGSATYAVLALLVLVGFALRMLVVGDQQANFDESHTSLVAQSDSIGALIGGLLSDVHPPVYFLVMMGWVKLFGSGELALRVPSILAGLALAPLTYALTRSFGGRVIWSLAAAAIISFAPILIYYSVEARSYTIFWVLTTAVILSLRRGLDSDDRFWWWWASGLTVVAFHTHLFAVFLLAPWAVTLIAATRIQRPQLVKVGLIGFVLSIPWAIVAASHQGSGIDWISWVWEGVGPSLWGSVKVATLSPPFPSYLGRLANTTLPGALPPVFLLWFGLPVLFGVVYCVTGRLTDGCRTSVRMLGQLLLPVACLTPPLGLALLSLHQPLYVVGRYELMAYPFWVALWALGLQTLSLRMRDKRLRGAYTVAACAVSLICMAVATQRYMAVEVPTWYFRHVADFLGERPDGDAIVTVGLLRAPIEHQLKRIEDQHELFSFPSHVADHVGWMDYSLPRPKLLEDASQLSRHLANRKTVWVLARHDGRGNLVLPDIPSALIDAFSVDGRKIADIKAYGLVMVLRLESKGDDRATMP